jgi:pimeloyl-ACP methyl ester carboxylesterase
VSREVLLASGLWMPRAGMALVGARLRAAGFSPKLFAYRGREPLEANVARLARFTREAFTAAPHFVGHSLGGVLIFDMLSQHREVDSARVVLLGAPVRGSLAGRRLGARAIGRWMLGGCASRWDNRPAPWQRGEALGVIAGTLPLGLGVALGRLPGQNDGVVCVEETAVEGMADCALVPQGHSMLAASAQVARLIARFLDAGRFG